jgi:hypothetical protein
VINGVAPAAAPQGSGTVRRTMNGIIPALSTHQFTPGVGGFPTGGGAGSDLDENVLNTALRLVWEQSNARIDTIVVGGAMKRRINQFLASARRYGPAETSVREVVSLYESDFGVARVVLSRWMPPDAVLLLDASRVEVMALSWRSFHYKPLASTGDRERGQVIGEYTLELRNEGAHAIIRGLT